MGAFAYAFSCDELSPAFVAVWYTAGIALTGALGWALGPRWLRWIIDAYIELKMVEVMRLQITPHPVEFDMYYSC